MRSDVTNFAKCGKESAYHCRFHRENCSFKGVRDGCPYGPKEQESEPDYECELDYGCSCNEGLDFDDWEVEPEWEWNEDHCCWECISCGDTQ